MTLPDSSAVDEALLDLLAGDGDLAALMPDGVYFDVAPPNASQFVLVTLASHSDLYQFQPAQGNDLETFGYAVQAVGLDTSGETVKAAAARIHNLLMSSLLHAEGYDCMSLLRRSRTRRTVVDAVNDVRWQFRGGIYEAMMQPLQPLTTKENSHATTR